MNQKGLIYLFISFFVLIMSWEGQNNHQIVAAYDESRIPEEAIRLRILANSDSPQDQWIKREIRDKVNIAVTEWVGELVDRDQAREVIQDNLADIEAIVASELDRIGSKQSFNVTFDDEVQFPTKLYGNYVYPAGNYEAILITIGEGKGENWWCVLFPPLCFLDFANGDAVAQADDSENAEEKEEGIEVNFFVFEVFTGLVDKMKTLFA
ncbi:stage II sporulation protein R [Anaerobacillus sp. MEB173]|uniref:stage II sporulation protein R n=1 Tax=Anaerobacillus sp. MEB173 TaxID=3383345 RepID=UPI003F9054BE